VPRDANRPYVDLAPALAMAALTDDQSQYPVQPGVQARLLPLLLPGLRARPAPALPGRPTGLLIRPRGGRERFLSCRAAASLIIRTLRRRPPSVPRLARLCGLTFLLGARARRVRRGARRIRIRTGMEAYACTRCGLCCVGLDMHDQCRPSDLEHWRGKGRQDILERTGPVDGRHVLWARPGTPLLEEDCPWLTPARNGNPASCGIHSCKPAICREYPGSYKHAVMTGCPAFLSPAARRLLHDPEP